jgi:hypothetical protein
VFDETHVLERVGAGVERLAILQNVGDKRAR